MLCGATNRPGSVPGSRTATLGGTSLQLTARELAIAELLMRRSPAAVDRLTIARHAWEDESDALGSNRKSLKPSPTSARHRQPRLDTGTAP